MRIMKQKWSIYLLLLEIMLVFVCLPPAWAEKSENAVFDVIFSINHLEKTLSLIDDLMGYDPEKPFESPINLLRVMIQGTNWIDPSRLITIGIKLEDPKIKTAVLIPYLRPNKNFRAIYKPVVGPDYYFLSLPPHNARVLPKESIEALLALSNSGPKKSLYLNFNPHTLLAQNSARIEQFLTSLKDMPQTPDQKVKGMRAQDLRHLIMALMNNASQLESIGLGFDLTPKGLTSSIEATARPNTDVFALFSQSCKNTYLFDYRPRFQINARSGCHDLKEMIRFNDAIFGKFYKQIGFDFSTFSQISDKFTGEMTGGMSLAEGKIDFEMMMVLARPDVSGAFLVKEYLPWLTNLNHEITVRLEKDSDQKIEPVFIRTKDSKVAEHEVIGFKVRIPSSGDKMTTPWQETLKEIFEYEVRMTTHANLLLCAGDDKQLHNLLLQAKVLKPKPSQAPRLAFDLDLSKYIQLMQKTLNMTAPPTEMGRINATVWMADGSATSTTTIQTRDIKTLIALYQKIKMIRSDIVAPKTHL